MTLSPSRQSHRSLRLKKPFCEVNENTADAASYVSSIPRGCTNVRDVLHDLSNTLQNRCFYNTRSDINVLADYEQQITAGVDDHTMPCWVPSADLEDVLKSALPFPYTPTGSPRLFNPVDSGELLLRLHQSLTLKPLLPLPRLVNYHKAFPLLQSASSYNFLIQLSIRHTSYGTSRQLFLDMATNGIVPDNETKSLFVRLMVRTGRWLSAWRFVQDEASPSCGKGCLHLLAELLGYRDPNEFNVKRVTNAVVLKQTDTSFSDAKYEWKEEALHVLLSNLSNESVPPDRVIFMIVRHLLRSSRGKIAKDVTLQWLRRLPRSLSIPKRRRCMAVVHLHLGLSPTGLKSHFANRKLVDKCCALHPLLRPSSSTLFLLLRSLQRVEKNPTFHAMQLVSAYQKKFGKNIIDQRVRRRIVSIATKEGRLNVARKWASELDRLDSERRIAKLVTQVVGEPGAKLPKTIKRRPFRSVMTGRNAEVRKWRWTRRRFIRRWLLMRKASSEHDAASKR